MVVRQQEAEQRQVAGQAAAAAVQARKQVVLAILHRYRQVREAMAAMDFQHHQIMVLGVAVVQVPWAQMEHLLQAVTAALVLLIQSQAVL